MTARAMDAAALLARALRTDGAAAGVAATLADASARPWSSATFTGERVTLGLRVVGDRAAWLAALPEADLPMRGWFVADLRIGRADGDAVELEALVLRAD